MTSINKILGLLNKPEYKKIIEVLKDADVILVISVANIPHAIETGVYYVFISTLSLLQIPITSASAELGRWVAVVISALAGFIGILILYKKFQNLGIKNESLQEDNRQKRLVNDETEIKVNTQKLRFEYKKLMLMQDVDIAKWALMDMMNEEGIEFDPKNYIPPKKESPDKTIM